MRGAIARRENHALLCEVLPEGARLARRVVCTVAGRQLSSPPPPPPPRRTRRTCVLDPDLDDAVKARARDEWPVRDGAIAFAGVVVRLRCWCGRGRDEPVMHATGVSNVVVRMCVASHVWALAAKAGVTAARAANASCESMTREVSLRRATRASKTFGSRDGPTVNPVQQVNRQVPKLRRVAW